MNGQGRYASQGAVASNGDESRISYYFFPGLPLCVQEEEWLLGAKVFIEHVLSQPCTGRRWQEDLF